jgi:hypothetical protein
VSRSLPAQLGQRLRETRLREPGCDPAAQPGACTHHFVLDGIAQDLPNLGFHAVAVARRTPLQAGLDVILDVSNRELSHDRFLAWRRYHDIDLPDTHDGHAVVDGFDHADVVRDEGVAQPEVALQVVPMGPMSTRHRPVGRHARSRHHRAWHAPDTSKLRRCD